MGYTHYWSPKPISDDAWVEVSSDLKRLTDYVSAGGTLLAREYDDPHQGPYFGSDHIQWNGVDDAGHETFYITRRGDGWSFCKTAHKPYDISVTAALIYLAKVAGYEVESDGDSGDWSNGLVYAKRVWPHLDLSIPLKEDAR